MAKVNAMLDKIEAKYRREYEIRLAQAKANFVIQLQMALHQSADAALMSCDDLFEVDEEIARQFRETHIYYVNKISHMAVVEDEDDPEMWWTKDTVDRRLKSIEGEENFVPWDERMLKGILK